MYEFLPADERDRLNAIQRFEILDSGPEPQFDRIVKQAAEILDAPIALLSIVDEKRAWFKARVGLDLQEIGRENSFCAHAILGEEVLVVPDAREDWRFAANPLVAGAPNVRFYAGAPLKTREGFRLGALGVFNTAPQWPLPEHQEAALQSLAALAVQELELRLVLKKAKSEETRRRDADRLLAGVFESAPVAIVISDKDSRVVTVNTACCELIGVTQDEIAGEPLASILSPREAGGRPVPGQARIRRKDGSVVDVHISGGPMVESGRGHFHITALMDVTAVRRLEENLHWREKMEAISDLSGRVAHEFNNLLAIITGFSQLTKNSVEPDDALSGFADEIFKATERGSVVTGKFLTFSGRRIGKRQQLDLCSVLSDLGGWLAETAGPDIVVNVSCPADLRKIHADPGHVAQIVKNLVLNAREAIPAAGEIRIAASNARLGDEYVRLHPGAAPGDYVRLSVSDTGAGIDAETSKHLFEPFFTTKGAGRGTGLAIVYGIVRQYAGQVSVDSEVGQGTTVEIYLPAIQSQG